MESGCKCDNSIPITFGDAGDNGYNKRNLKTILLKSLTRINKSSKGAKSTLLFAGELRNSQMSVATERNESQMNLLTGIELEVQQQSADIEELAGSNVTGSSEMCQPKNISLVSVPDLAVSIAQYIPRIHVSLSRNFVHSLNEFVHLISAVCESQDYILDSFSKYIKDNALQNQLVQSALNYTKVNSRFENRLSVTANAIWLEHTKLIKRQDEKFKRILCDLVSKGKKLEQENAQLRTDIEKLYQSKPVKKKAANYIQYLVANTKHLQKKADTSNETVQKLEYELYYTQKQNHALEDYHKTLTSEKYYLMNDLNKVKRNWRLEEALLKSQINDNTKVHHDAISLSRSIFEYCELLQRKDNIFNFDQDVFLKIQKPNCNLMDVMNGLKICVLDLGKAVSETSCNTNILLKDIESLREANKKLQTNLHKSTTELDCISKKLNEVVVQEQEKNILQVKCETLEKDLESLRMKLAKTTATNQTFEELTKELGLNENALKKEQSLNRKLYQENDIIRTQLERFISQHKNTEYLSSQFILVTSDKEQLTDKLEKSTEDIQMLLEQQQVFHQQIMAQHEESESLRCENTYLRQELTTEKETVLCLQNERIKFLDEKNVLQTIFQQLKTEVDRVQFLEGTVASMSEETNQLMTIAEYNKQLGEQLKCEVAIRDNTIMQLSEKVEHLNSIQENNNNDKVNLNCQLTEVNRVNEHLYRKLLKKAHEIECSNKSVNDEASTQLNVMKNMQRDERDALKELLKQFKQVVKENKHLLKVQDKYKQEVAYLLENLKKLTEKNSVSSSTVHTNRNIMNKSENKDDNIKSSEKQMQKSTDRVGHLENKIKQMLSDKQEADETIDYLKNTVSKMHKDLNVAYKQIKEKEDTCNVYEDQRATWEKETLFTKELVFENEKLREEVSILEEARTKISADYCTTFKQYEHELEKQQKEYQEHIKFKAQETDKILKDLNKLQGEYENIKHQVDKEQNVTKAQHADQLRTIKTLEASKKEVGDQLKSLKLKCIHISDELSKKDKENVKLMEHIHALKNELDAFKNHCTEKELALQGYTIQKESIANEIVEISKELELVNQDFYKERQLCEELQQKQNELELYCSDLHKALQEKESVTEDLYSKLIDSNKYLKRLKHEHAALREQYDIIIIERDEITNVNSNLRTEKKSLDVMIIDLQNRYDEIVANYLKLEKEYKERTMEVDEYREKLSCTKMTHEMVLKEKTFEIENITHRLSDLKEQLNKSQGGNMGLKNKIMELQEQITYLEFQKCELTLQLHETNGNLHTESLLNDHFKPYKDKLPVPPSTDAD